MRNANAAPPSKWCIKPSGLPIEVAYGEGLENSVIRLETDDRTGAKTPVLVPSARKAGWRLLEDVCTAEEVSRFEAEMRRVKQGRPRRDDPSSFPAEAELPPVLRGKIKTAEKRAAELAGESLSADAQAVALRSMQAKLDAQAAELAALKSDLGAESAKSSTEEWAEKVGKVSEKLVDTLSKGGGGKR